MFIINDLVSISTLYFFYGLTFLFLGASIALKDMKASQLKISNSLWLLSLFGFAHGSHEWIQLFLLNHSLQFSNAEIYGIKVLALIVVGVSFLFLLLFGLSLIFSIRKNKYINQIKLFAIILFALLFLYFFALESGYQHLDFFKIANNILRKTFGFIGSLVASYGLILYSREIKKISLPISRYFLYSGLGFYFYGIFAGLIQSHVKIPIFLIPVEFFRGVCAVLITYFLFKALNIFDIYTRNQLEKQLKNQAQSEKMVSLGLLSAGVAHEINSPLTNASLNMQMLKTQFKTSLDNEKIQKKLDVIDRNIDRASIIAKELLQFSQTQDAKLVPMDVNPVLNSAIDQVRNKINNNKINNNKSFKIKILIQQEDLPYVEMNAAKLEQVFLNVINNSIEAMDNTGELLIQAKKSKGNVRIVISDDGAGISQEHFPKVFDPFFTTKKSNQGTGLGLSICHGIIEQHGGTIALVNNNRGGVDTKIELPVP
jgi:two-component system NtrC family sensor kinase